MVHTFEMQVMLRHDEIRHHLTAAGCPEWKLNGLLRYTPEKSREGRPVTSIVLDGIGQRVPGIKCIRATKVCFPGARNRSWSRFFLSIAMEPQFFLDGKRHIRLLECTEENIRRLREKFREVAVKLFRLDGSGMEYLADISAWNAKRVDYTFDATMGSRDEALAFVNLAKWAAVSGRTHYAIGQGNAYGKSFYDHGLRLGNGSRVLAVYDKRRQVERCFRHYRDGTRERLMEEADRIVRIELRVMKERVGDMAKKLGKSILAFLSEEIGNEELAKVYGRDVGFGDFCSKYQARKRLSEAYPLTKEEQRQQRRDIKAAEAAGKPTGKIRTRISRKASECLWLMGEVAIHKGLGNALRSMTGSGHRASTGTILKRIQDAGLSPVMIPEAWIYKRGLKLPTVLENPLKLLKPSASESPKADFTKTEKLDAAEPDAEKIDAVQQHDSSPDEPQERPPAPLRFPEQLRVIDYIIFSRLSSTDIESIFRDILAGKLPDPRLVPWQAIFPHRQDFPPAPSNTPGKASRGTAA